MLPPRAIEVESHDLASRVDAEGLGARGAGHLDRREHAPIIEKPMLPRAIGVDPHDLATRVDPAGFGGNGARNIEGREGKRRGLGAVAPPQEEAQGH